MKNKGKPQCPSVLKKQYNGEQRLLDPFECGTSIRGVHDLRAVLEAHYRAHYGPTTTTPSGDILWQVQLLGSLGSYLSPPAPTW